MHTSPMAWTVCAFTTFPTPPIPTTSATSLNRHSRRGGQQRGCLGPLRLCCHGSDVLRVYDISDPTSPIPVANDSDSGYASGVAVLGNYLLLSESFFDGFHYAGCASMIFPVQPVSSSSALPAMPLMARTLACMPKLWLWRGIMPFLANHLDGLRIYQMTGPPLNIFRRVPVPSASPGLRLIPDMSCKGTPI